MVEWNGLFQLLRFSRILGQPREVQPKFWNEIPETSLPFASPPEISGISGQMESTPEVILSCCLATCIDCCAKRRKIRKNLWDQGKLRGLMRKPHQPIYLSLM